MPQATNLPIDQGPVPLQRQPTDAENAELSPTAMIQNYLSQRGYQPTSENVRRALEANARDPGVISGLRSDQAGPNTGGGGGGPSLPVPPVPPTLEHTNQPTPERTSAQPTPPPGTGGDGSGLGGLILSLLAPFGMNMGRTPPPGDPNLKVGMPPQTGAPITASESLGLTGPPAQVTGPAANPQLPAPPKQITGPPAPAEAPVAKPGEVIPQPGPTSAAIDKAVEPPATEVKPRIRAKAGSSPRVRVPAVRGARL